MTCAHVLGLIDAGPFAEYPPEHLAAAFDHARACPACGAAFAATQAIATDLAAMPRVDAPPDLEKVVMARIARLDDQAVAVPAADRAWTAGAVIAGAIVAAMAFAIELSVAWKLLTPRPDTVLALFLVSLLTYSVGLFAPLAGQRRPLRED